MPNKGISDKQVFKQSSILKALSPTDKQAIYEKTEIVVFLIMFALELNQG